MRVSPFIQILTGFIIWSAAFLLLYATQATGCHLGWHELDIGPVSVLRLLLTTIFVLVLALLGGLFWSARQVKDSSADRSETLTQIATTVHIAAIVSTLITFSGLFWLTLC
jgi:heme/copper-type cytochrome/quinol oxidase subunit 2